MDIVTGHPDSEFMTRAVAFGLLALLSKPVETEQLDQVIRIARSTARKEMTG